MLRKPILAKLHHCILYLTISQSFPFNRSVTENSSTAYEFLEFKLPSDISNCFYIQLYLSDGDNVLSENNYRLLVGDQKAAQETAYGMYKIMHQKSREYGKGYYRYFPDMFSDL